MPSSTPSSPSTVARLRQEIEHLRKLIRQVEADSLEHQPQRWYLQMLRQSLVRKRAALDYIEEADSGVIGTSTFGQGLGRHSS